MRINLLSPVFVSWCLVMPAHADTQVISDFRNWVIERDMQPAALVALGEDGQILASVGIDASIDTPFPIASISKTFGAQCALFMADKGMVSLDDPISLYLSWTGQQGAVTLSELLTHSSGFGPDATQNDTEGALLGNAAGLREIVDSVASRPLGFPSGTHHYNNENYLILETVMAVVVGDDVFEWCHRNAPSLQPLTSLGLYDELNPEGLAGGLEISAAELAEFFYSLNQGAVDDWPSVWFASNNSYGPGVVMQAVPDGINLLHSGSICVPGGPNLGGFAVRFAKGTSVAMVYSGCAGPEDYSVINRLAFDLLEQSESEH